MNNILFQDGLHLYVNYSYHCLRVNDYTYIVCMYACVCRYALTYKYIYTHFRVHICKLQCTRTHIYVFTWELGPPQYYPTVCVSPFLMSCLLRAIPTQCSKVRGGKSIPQQQFTLLLPY